MISSLVKLCIILYLTVKGVQGSELTISVMKNATVTLECSSHQDLTMCSCPSYPQNCNKCTDAKPLTGPSTIYGAHKYFRLSGLEHNNSGLYACKSIFYDFNQKYGKKYRINVLEDQAPAVVIGTAGQSMVISCGAERLDSMAASDRHWCRLSDADVCQPDTVMGPENATRGDFRILDSHSSFCLEKRWLTQNDSGRYRFTQTSPNHTIVHVVELQVKEKPSFLQISAKQKSDELFELRCQYSQELQEFSKSWLCDDSECPETVTNVDDRFQSALVLTIAHVICSGIRHFQCMVKTSGSPIKSNVYGNQSPIDVKFSDIRRKRVQVPAYSLLNLICFKPDRYFMEYDRIYWGRWDSRINDHYYQDQPYWCKMSHKLCLPVNENIRKTVSSITLQICVMPSDDGTIYRCLSSRVFTEVEIVVKAVFTAPPPHATPELRPITPETDDTKHKLGIIIVVTLMTLLIVSLCVAVTRYQGKKIRERMFARRTPLSAVDVHANMYANSVALYYSHHRRQAPPSGDDMEDSSSLDDEFEELPVRPGIPSSIMREETDYIRVKPGGAAQSHNVHDLLRANEQFGQGGLPLRNHGNVSGSGRKGEVGNTELSNNKEADDDITYTHVIIKPKNRQK